MTQESSHYTARLGELLDRLGDVEEKLAAVSDSFDERIRFREEQRELRALAARLRQEARTPTEVARELDHLKRLRHKILSGHVSVGHVGGGNGPGGGGMEPRYVFAMNEAIDNAWGRADLEERIEKLEVALEDLRGG